MKNMRVVASLFLLGTAATAGAADNGFYFGVAGGQARYDFEPMRIPQLAGWGPIVPGGVLTVTPPNVVPVFGMTPSLPVPGESFYRAVAAEPLRVFWIPGQDDEATTWNVLAGYRFLRYAAVEIAYHDLGTLHDYSPARSIGPLTTIEVKSVMESTAATLSLLGELPITDMWSVYLRAGGMFADQEVSRRFGSSAHFNESYDSEVFLYGIGTQLDFGAHWTVRLDFQRYDDVGKGNGIGEADVDSLTLGVLFRLGGN